MKEKDLKIMALALRNVSAKLLPVKGENYMRIGMIAAAAAALLCATQADAARYYEFELKGAALVPSANYYTPDLNYIYASTIHFVFDTLNVGQATPTPNYYQASGRVDAVMLRVETNSPLSGNLVDIASPTGPIFDFVFRFADVAAGSTLASLPISNYGYAYRAQVDGRYSVYIDGGGQITSVMARTSDIAPAFSGLTLSTTITAVPEPAAWAMMIAGFGVVGYAMRRRRGRVAVAVA